MQAGNASELRSEGLAEDGSAATTEGSRGAAEKGRRRLELTTEPPKEQRIHPKDYCGVSKTCWEADSAAIAFIPKVKGADIVVEMADSEVKPGQFIALGFSDDNRMVSSSTRFRSLSPASYGLTV